MIRKFLIMMSVVTVIAALSWAAPTEQDIDHTRSEACQMMSLWHESDGEYGWPPEYAAVFCSEAGEIER